MNIKAILFDMDGVLVDSFDAWYHLFCSALEHFGQPAITREEFIQQAWAIGYETVSRRYFAAQDVAEVAQYYSTHFLDHLKHIRAIDGIAGVLEQARKQGIDLAVITNTHVQLAEKILGQLGLLKHFETIIGGDTVARGKPAPDMVLLACRQLGIKPAAAIVVGDTEYDMAAAREAGCLAVGFKIAGDVQINSPEELLGMIGQKND
jgi:phosphoglycolate phosphatase